MLEQWEKHECWVAYFDILGFKSLLEKKWMEFETVLSQTKIDDILNDIENISPLYREHIDYLFYADTFTGQTHLNFPADGAGSGCPIQL